MPQTSLSGWVQGAAGSSEAPRRQGAPVLHLTLDWATKGVRLTDGALPGAATITTIKGRKASYAVDYVGALDGTRFVPERVEYSNVPMMKSLLQKAIRRCDYDVAVKASRNLMNMDVRKFLRRLPIIIVEDVTVVSDISICIWMMIAESKGFALLQEHADYLLGVVEDLCMFERKSRFYVKDDTELDESRLAEHPNGALLASLIIRRKYGGMKGDMNMLTNAVNKFRKATSSVPSLCVEPIRMVDVGPLLRSEWVLAAVDFHVCSIAKRLAAQTGKAEKVVRSLMWRHSSSLNYRRKLAVAPQEWKDIEGEYETLSRWWIDRVA